MPPKRGRRATTGASEAGQRALENGGCTGSVRRAARRFQRTPSNVKRLLEVVQQFHALGPLAAEGESVLGQCRAVATLLESEGIPISEPTVVKTTTDEITAYVERTKMKAQSPDTDVDRLLDQIIAQKEEFDKYEDGKNAAAAAKNAQDAILRGLAADTRRVATESLEASRVNADARAPAQPRPWVATPVGQFVGGAEVSEAETDLRKRKLAVQEQAVENDRKRIELQAENESAFQTANACVVRCVAGKRLELELAKLASDEKDRAERRVLTDALLQQAQNTNDTLLQLLRQQHSSG